MDDEDYKDDENKTASQTSEPENDMDDPYKDTIDNNLVSRKVYNDVIDEEIDLEQPEDIPPQNKKIENNHIDEVIQISSESGEDVPSPRDNPDGVFPMDDIDHEQKMEFGEGEALGNDEALFEGYNPAEYMSLNVDDEVKKVFQFITNYVPIVTEIESIFKPFIPEYIPAVGEVDAFLKIPRPDGTPEQLGLYQIDEPALNQTKKSEMDYIIKEFYMGDKSKGEEKVHSVENAHKNPKEIASWITTVDSMQSKKYAPSVIYTQKMPEIDNLLEAWDHDFEKAICEIPLPCGD